MSITIARNKQFKFNQLKTSFKRYFITGILGLFDSWKEVELNLTNISRMLPSMQCFQEDILEETQKSWNHDEEWGNLRQNSCYTRDEAVVLHIYYLKNTILITNEKSSAVLRWFYWHCTIKLHFVFCLGQINPCFTVLEWSSWLWELNSKGVCCIFSPRSPVLKFGCSRHLWPTTWSQTPAAELKVLMPFIMQIYFNPVLFFQIRDDCSSYFIIQPSLY